MPSFSASSNRKLSTTDYRLQLIFNEVVKEFDCTIICGHRTEDEQNAAYNAIPKKSQLRYPESKHNKFPSKAVDVAPYYRDVGIDWSDHIGFAYFAGYVKRVAEGLGYRIRWGGDWDMDRRNKDQTFNDLPHFEILG